MITNIAAYQFAHLTDLKALRESLLARCKAEGLKGTILLSPEGINLFVAGTRAAIDGIVTDLREIPGLASLAPKFSESADQPFNRMLVRIKKEIIAFGIDGIDPAARPSPKLSATTLKQWLDEGRAFTLLDTRNDYEVKLGTFRGARTLGIDHFREFPSATKSLPATLKDEPLVMFCTGGIRCEKAGPYMEREGFRQIFQLDGGILKYFEECGGAHYDGECFVFDQRVGVDPNLRETEAAVCFACLAPLTTEDQQDPRFQPPHSCPYCHKPSADLRAELLAARNEALRRATTPLPGSMPGESRRPVRVPAKCDGQALLDMLATLFPHVSREDWGRTCETGGWRAPDGSVADAARCVRAGECYERRLPGVIEPDVNAGIRLLHEDEAILVLAKPAPLPMHPGGRFARNTLQAFLASVYAPQNPRSVHRLDANTTGVVLLARTRHFARLLQPQFERGEVEKTYLALVPGSPPAETFTCDAPISAAPGELGTRSVDAEDGQPARTEFRVLERRADGTTLLEVRPLTGRTNQIRIHLWQLGLPICGDPAYRPDRQLGDTQTLPVAAPPLCLHAWRLTFRHPLSQEAVTFEAPPPAWAGDALPPAKIDSPVLPPAAEPGNLSRL